MGYRLLFITTAGWHLVSYYGWRMAKDLLNPELGLAAYAKFQEVEVLAEAEGFLPGGDSQGEAGAQTWSDLAQLLTEGKSGVSDFHGIGSTADQFKQGDQKTQSLLAQQGKSIKGLNTILRTIFFPGTARH